jgi:hypothetical protein
MGNCSRRAIVPNEFRKQIHRPREQNIWIRKLRILVGADIIKLSYLTQIRALQEKPKNISSRNKNKNLLAYCSPRNNTYA